MSEIFIDNKRFEFEEADMVLQFILDHGLDLPFFCYHEKLSIPANCRQCLVEAGTPVKNRETGEFELDENGEREIRWFPKLMTACSLQMQDGMVIKTHVSSEKVVRAQKDNLEFILINHPLECPICDQAGECPLQIQTYKYGPEGSRFEHKKVHKPKRIELGPRVILDAERCINCTRCVRFTEEISKTNQLTIVSRGDKNYPITAPEDKFDDPYSLNTVDLCPVGALTAADFRFKARVWEMNQTPSIDITNGKGCSIDLWTRDNLVLRITPRKNPNVNDYWMPDSGRDAYRNFNENRISKPSVKIEDGDHIKTSWNNARATLGEWLSDKKVVSLASPHASVEDNYSLKKFTTAHDGDVLGFIPDVEKGFGDGFLVDDDKAPNTNGVQLLDIDAVDASVLKSKLTDAAGSVLFILQEDVIGRELISSEDLSDLTVVYFGTNNNSTSEAADLVIPITCIAEHSASYVNVDGRIQRSIPAKETMHTERRTHPEMIEGRLDRYGTKFDNWKSDKNRVDCYPFWEFMSGLEASAITFAQPREIISEVALKFKPFSGVTYDRMDEELGVQIVEKEEINLA
jgi:NADH-quinone oxidoreductase subunit G